MRKELRSAVHRLTSDASEGAIHDARKRIKKVRAVLQLVGDDLAAGRAPERLRRASHLLSPLRDVNAMLETARGLGARSSAGSTRVRAAIDAQLTTEKARLTAAAGRDQVRTKAARVLDQVRRDARHWRWKTIKFAALATAIKRSYKRARNRMQDAGAERQPDSFHEWRKRVKTLWYALRLLESRVPRLRRGIPDFKRLETSLGDDHNLFVLQEHFESATSTRVGARARAHLRTLTGRRQRELRQQALAIGARLFADQPKAFARRLRELWDASTAKRAAA